MRARPSDEVRSGQLRRNRYLRAAVWFGIAGLFLGVRPVEDGAPLSPKAILERTFDNLYGFNSIQRVDIRSIEVSGRAFLRSVQVVRRGSRDGLNRMLVRFIGPEDLRGIGVLLMERADYQYDAFLFQPSLDRVRRITVAQRHDRFFGTDVFFEDLESRRADQWEPEFVRTETLESRQTQVLRLVPREIPSAYSEIVAWIDSDLPVILRAEFYREGVRLKTMRIDANHIDRVGGYYIPRHWTFRSSDAMETVIDISDVQLRDELPDRLFTRTALQFGDPEIDSRQ
jgi:outer membrane lipoprotein-sorting protein